MINIPFVSNINPCKHKPQKISRNFVQMSTREIRCPHCGEWTLWQGKVDDRCLFCGEFLEPQRFSREIEKKINDQLKKEDDYFAIKPSDGPFLREVKPFLNSLRWILSYMQLALFAFVTLVLVLISLLTG